MQWVIDTDVMVKADQGLTDHEHDLKIIDLTSIIRREGHFLALDSDWEIENQYRRNIDPRGNIIRFLNYLAKNGRLVHYSGNVPNPLKTKLRSLNFHNDDYVFVGVAGRTRDKILLAEETDYDS